MTFSLHSLRARLLVSMGIPVVLFVLAAGVAFLTIQRLLGTLDLEQTSERLIARAHDLKAAVLGMQSAKRGLHLPGRPGFTEEFDFHRRNYLDNLAALNRLADNDPDHREHLDALTALAQPLQEPSRGDLKELARAARRAAAELDALIATEQTRLDARHHLVQQATRESIWAIGATLLGTLALAVLIPLQLSRSVIRPINQLRDAASRLRVGEFTTLTPEGPAELASLMSYFNLMGLAFSERESLLQTSERRYQGLMGALSHLLWTTDPQGAVTDGTSWSAFTGQSEEAVRGEGWLGALHPDDRERVADHWRQALERRQPYEDEFRVLCLDDGYRIMACRCVPILSSRGECLEWVCTCADVTGQKEEEELRRAKEEAEATSRAKTAFLTRMSHELRTPLNAIIGMSKMLSTLRFGPLNAKQADYLADITRAGEHLLDLINDVLDLSRVEAGHMEVTLAPVPVTATVGAALSPLGALAEAKGVRLTFETPEPDGVIVTDEGRFRQVLLNLVSNAVKFTPERHSVLVRCRWVAGVARGARPAVSGDAGGLRVDVEDSGIGIAPEHHESIWQEFRQVSTPGRTTEGTGLGLALCRRLVGLLGGEVWLESSSPGAGSCFSFVLPLRPAGADTGRALGPTQRANGHLRRGRRGRKPLALVVEDHGPTNKLVSDWLLDAGLETSSAFDGPTGLEQARRLRPRLILLDLRLPRLDGRQVLAELKADPHTRDIPVMILSSDENRELRPALDVVDWLVKPLDREQFLERLRQHCPDLFAPDGRPLTVLVADADATARVRLAELLAEEGVEVVQAAGGEEALARLEEQLPNLVLLDLRLPGLDGFALVEAIRSRSRLAHLPVLVVTAADLSQEEWRRLRGNIEAVLRKDTLTREKLAERLRRLGLPLAACTASS